MADTNTNVATMPAKPSTGEIVKTEVLASRQLSTLALAKGFGGQSSPTVIWESMIRDNPWAYIYYRELEEKDEDIAEALEMLKLSVMGREREIAPADDSQQALDVANFVKEQLDGISDFQRVLDSILDAAGYGVSISEMMFDVSAGQVALADIKDCPQEMFTFGEPYLPQVGPLHYLGNLYTVGVGIPVPEEKFIIFSYRPRARNRRGRPLLRGVFWPSWFKRQAQRFWLRFAEKGPGTAAVMYPQSATDDEKQKALEAAENIIEKIAVAFPENFKLVEKLLESARSQDPSVYEHLVDSCKMSIARRILGQTLTSHGNEGGTGSQALGEVHQDIFDLKSIELAVMLESVINNQLVKPLVLWNFGPQAPMPKLTIAKKKEKDLASRVKIEDTLQTMGLDIPESYVRKTYGVPELKSATRHWSARRLRRPTSTRCRPGAAPKARSSLRTCASRTRTIRTSARCSIR
jgi:phage gp29-like protein